MDLVQGFSYVTKDPKWFKKMLIGALITSVPILGPISNGYQLQTIRNLIKGKPQPLPEWQGMDKLFGNGFQLSLAVWMIYIPGIILGFIGWFNGLSQLFSLLFYATDADTQTRLGVTAGRHIVEIIVSALWSLLTLALPIAFQTVPAMALRCAKTNSFIETINIFAHFKFILQNLGDYVLAIIAVLVMLFLFSLLASVVGGITFFIVGLGGWLVLSLGRFWGRMMWAYYLAQMELKN
jgi:hypothetical protein